ncbi:MAG: FadR family transcriptional regulator [Alphaproteobacteria bacterium]|nr:MAG: FadR family transcriptional regulator [Alphaproteobacteria bacterium]
MAKSAYRDQENAPLPQAEEGSGLVLVPGRRQSLADQLYGQLLDQLVSGRLNEGDRLPPEKEICSMFGVSRPVVRDALARLRADGLLQARQGSGTYVLRRPSGRLAGVANSSEIAVFLRCLEARMPLEAASARLAAERRTGAQLQKMRAAHEKLGEEVERGSATAPSDLDFHMAIAEATGNEFYPALLNHLVGAISGFMDVSLYVTRTGSRERQLQAFREHCYIFEAIENQEPDNAEVAMRFHIGQSRERLTDRSRDN